MNHIGINIVPDVHIFAIPILVLSQVKSPLWKISRFDQLHRVEPTVAADFFYNASGHLSVKAARKNAGECNCF